MIFSGNMITIKDAANLIYDSIAESICKNEIQIIPEDMTGKKRGKGIPTSGVTHNNLKEDNYVTLCRKYFNELFCVYSRLILKYVMDVG